MSVMLGACAGCGSSGPLGAMVATALQFFAASQCLLSEPYPKQADVANGSSFDFIIVGGGTGGSALAARLAERHQFQVLLVEAGGDPPVEGIIPGFRSVLKESPYDWNFTTIDDGFSSQGLAGHHEKQPRGKMLGGSGTINDMVYARGYPTDYNEWADIVGDSWNWTNVLPYFMKTEHMTDRKIADNEELMKLHGVDGEIEVSGAATYDKSTIKFLKAFEELGLEIVDDMTNPHKIGAGRFSHTIRDGRRDSTLTAMLNKVQTGNLHVLKDTFVTKILIENDTAVGIQAFLNDKEYYFYADKEVIVTAGTFNTAKLLMLSGIGPKDHLEEVGIDVVQDLPVGENLHDHVMVLYFLATESGTCSYNESTKLFEVIKYLHDATGALSYSDSMGAYLPQNADTPNLPYFAMYPTCVPVGQLTVDACTTAIGYTAENCAKIVAENAYSEIIPLPVVLLKPKSRGMVRLASTNPLDDPMIYSGTFDNEEDLEGFPEAVKFALSLVNTTYFKEMGTRIIDLTPEECKKLSELDMIKCHVVKFATSAWHSVGTAALGGVLDAQLRVRGLAALRVADASVMPRVVRGNTNAPVVMIAEKAARFIKDAYGLDNEIP
ncbi:glucose dehydrogenase [FAD, quinone]-like [Trichoplusia ni]|uniref:Glucose dehydrogenase [FAD, quinone]-like n=1 Tax=Trichoplusia ni TaxID=7111 RepID=A0A7E5X2G3_TRINI|nr:glucose dehydrogenase [FAD, quinone]-like [Trichoplusia ni]XP_026746860.1 glucose dehydrogenase [FAD, quinone]-like [Trichoplusia ni]XP_026746861.1 glucose dehydrogenase [FAD, quinone]-like [Trichoplusia ni]XP_026746862.1 glucose dehydrogenase [FAD, quinone]-like [Trichoplusia ni]